MQIMLEPVKLRWLSRKKPKTLSGIETTDSQFEIAQRLIRPEKT